MSPVWKYHIAPATADLLRREYGIIETDLLGMRCLVGPGPAPGKVYMVVEPLSPLPPPIRWLAFNMGPILKDPGAVVIGDIT